MELWTKKQGPLPRRKRKSKPNPLEDMEQFLQLRAMVLSGKLKPHEEVGILVTTEDGRKMGQKWPWRTVTDHIRRAIREAGLQSDYRVVKYETDTPGVWFVKVRHEPPMIKSKVG